MRDRLIREIIYEISHQKHVHSKMQRQPCRATQRHRVRQKKMVIFVGKTIVQFK